MAEKRRKTDEIERDFDAFFLYVFLPPALSKEKLKDASTLASFGILINRIFRILQFDGLPFVADSGRMSLNAAFTIFSFLLKLLFG